MARRTLDNEGNVTHVTYESDTEVLALLEVSPDQYATWKQYLGGKHKGSQITFTPAQLKLAHQRAAVLKTGMSIEDVQAVEGRNLMPGYAQLAVDAPAGITAHVWRSYAVVVLYQSKHHKALNAYELAEIAQLQEVNPLTGKLEESPQLAKMHLALLGGEKLLVMQDGAWRHHGLPQCLQKSAQQSAGRERGPGAARR